MRNTNRDTRTMASSLPARRVAPAARASAVAAAPPAPSVADLVDAQRRQQAHDKSVSMEKLGRLEAARTIGAAARAAIIRRGIDEAALLPPSPDADDADCVRDRDDDEYEDEMRSNMRLAYDE